MVAITHHHMGIMAEGRTIQDTTVVHAAAIIKHHEGDKARLRRIIVN